MTGLYRRLLRPILAPSLLLGVATGATVPVQILAAMQLGASASVAAMIVAVMGGIGLLTTVHAGRLIDRLGDRRAMIAATGVVAILTGVTIATLVHGGSGALPAFVAASFLRAPAMNVWGLARQAYTAEHVEPQEIGRAMTALGGTMRVGNLIGPLVGGLLLLTWPVWSVYAFSILCAVAATMLLANPAAHARPVHRTGPSASVAGQVGPDTPGRGVRDDGEGRADGGGPESPERDPQRPSAPDTQAAAPRMGAVRWRAVVLAGVAITMLAVARAGQPVIVQLWGVHSGLSASTISLVVAVGAAVEIVLMFPGGHLKDRLGRSVILTICLLVYGTGFLLLVPLTAEFGLPGLVAAAVVMAVGNGLGAGVNMTIGADLSPSVGRARFLGIWALFSNVGVLAGPMLISLLVGTAGVEAAVLAVGAVAVTGAAWTVALVRGTGLPGPRMREDVAERAPR